VTDASLLQLPSAPIVFQQSRATQKQRIFRLGGGGRLLEADKGRAVVGPMHLECRDAFLLSLDQLRFKSGADDPMQKPVHDLPVRTGDVRLRMIQQKSRLALPLSQPFQRQRSGAFDGGLRLRIARGLAHASI